MTTDKRQRYRSRRVASVTAVLALSTTPVFAGGIERTNQSLNVLFEKGNYFELSYGHVSPSLSGTDLDLFVNGNLALPGGAATGDVGKSYNNISLAYKHQFNENFSGAIILDSPFGADIHYPVGGSRLLGGTSADVEAMNLTGIVRWTNNSGFGAHAGVRMSRADASVDLRGLAYGPLDGYSVTMDTDTAWGWLAGISYEIPEYAARVALTYNSPIEHDFNTTESGPLIDPDGPGPAPALPLLNGESRTKVKTPRSWNLEFQSGVAEDTLVFGSIRWVKWSEFRVDPERFTPIAKDGLVDLENTTTYTLGVGRRFTDEWSGSASFSWEKEGKKLVSPLAPTTGRKGITLAAVYTQDKFKVTTGINYTWLGDATPETGTPDVARASMEDNHALGIGIKVGYSF